MKKNIIIVTGGAGFIGSSLINFLIKKKISQKIISIDNYSTGNKKNHIKHKNVKYIKGENGNIFKLLENVKGKVHTIFHFGEYSRIYQSYKDYRKCIDYNINQSFKVIDFAKNYKVRIIYSATSSVSGEYKNDKDLSPYSWSKSKNIELIKNYSRWFKLKYELVYFYNVYGPNQIKNSPMSAVIGIFENQFEKKKPLTVVKPGSQKRDFTHIDDIVRGCYLAWKKGNQNEYMLGTKKNYTIYQIAKMFKTKVKFLPKRPGDRKISLVINNNAEKILGYKPEKNIKDYINKFIKNN